MSTQQTVQVKIIRQVILVGNRRGWDCVAACNEPRESVRDSHGRNNSVFAIEYAPVTVTIGDRKLGRGLEAAGIGTEIHYRMVELALEAQKRGRLPFELNIAATVGRSLPQPVHPTRGKAKKLRTVGPDFVLRGRVRGEQVDAAWELTTNTELARHYDRDIGNKKKGKQEPEYSAEIGVREHDDRSCYWSSYIAIATERVQYANAFPIYDLT